jgi:hypothetical protein
MEEIKKELDNLKMTLVYMSLEGQLNKNCANYLKLHEVIGNLTRIVEKAIDEG